MRNVGRSINTTNEPVTTTVEINSVTATTILPANSKRIYAIVSLDSGVTDIEAFVREFAAAVNDIKVGEILSRRTMGALSIYKPIYRTMVDNPYTGEISAIAVSGSFNLHIIEG